MNGPNDFQHSEEYYKELFKNNMRSAMVPLPAADDIEELTENSTAPKPSNEEIALRLVEAWAGQYGGPAGFDRVMDKYFEALDRLNEKESKDA